MIENSLKRFMQRLPRYFFSLIWGVCILIVCVINFSQSPLNEIQVFEGADKWVHGILYFILMWIVIWEFRKRERIFQKRANTKRLFWISLLLPFIWGGFIEYIQRFLPYRGEESMDLVADVIGSLFAFFIYNIVVLYNVQK